MNNKAVYKYSVNDGLLFLPRGAVLLDIQYQHGVPTLWALVDPNEPVAPHRVVVLGTGWATSYQVGLAPFRRTLQDGNGFVWHYFVGVPG